MGEWQNWVKPGVWLRACGRVSGEARPLEGTQVNRVTKRWSGLGSKEMGRTQEPPGRGSDPKVSLRWWWWGAALGTLAEVAAGAEEEDAGVMR